MPTLEESASAFQEECHRRMQEWLQLWCAAHSVHLQEYMGKIECLTLMQQESLRLSLNEALQELTHKQNLQGLAADASEYKRYLSGETLDIDTGQVEEPVPPPGGHPELGGGAANGRDSDIVRLSLMRPSMVSRQFHSSVFGEDEEEDEEEEALRSDAVHKYARDRRELAQQLMRLTGWQNHGARKEFSRKNLNDVVRNMWGLTRMMSILEIPWSNWSWWPNDPKASPMLAVTHSGVFQAVVAMLIFSNSCVIGVHADISMRCALDGRPEPAWGKGIDIFFCIAFSVELLCRLVAERGYFFIGRMASWNFFDSALVALAVLDLSMASLNVTFIRIVRLIRVIRVARIIRVIRLFKELRFMVCSVYASMSSLTWAFLLLMLFMYCFAVCFMQAGAAYIYDGDVDPETEQLLAKHYRSLAWTLFTLLCSTTGGVSWRDVALPLYEINTFYLLVFCFFITFMVFGALNVLTAVFVEQSAAVLAMDKDLVIQEQMDRNSSLLNQMEALFREVDKDGSGDITWQEFQDVLHDHRVQSYFAVLKIDLDQAEGLFQLLDLDGSGSVSIQEFILSCMRIKGAARSIDVATVIHENKKSVRHIQNWCKEIKNEVSLLAGKLDKLTGKRRLDRFNSVHDLMRVSI